MAAPSNHNAVSQDTLITIKVSVNDSLKKLKLPLRDLGANVLPDKVCELLVHACPPPPARSPVVMDNVIITTHKEAVPR